MIDKLKTLVEANRVPHALVIDGGTYESRLICAKELAASLIGETEKVMNDFHPDVITVLPEEKKKTLSVDVIRRMRDDAYIIPNENERKVYIIAKAELMQDYAQNALLKILEEPPAYATFILLCDSHSLLLGTILSRVAIFTLGEEQIPIDEEAKTAAKRLADKIARRDSFGLLIAISRFEKDFDLLTPVLDILQNIIRDALVLKSGGTDLIGDAEKEANALASSLSIDELMNRQEGISDIVKAINIYANKNLTLTRLVSKLNGGPND